MDQIDDSSFDTILSTQLLEHVSNPWLAMREFSRVLRPGGTLILSAPHLSMMHEAPNDYFRFTSYGFEVLCADSGFQVVDVRPVGGLLSLVAHVLSLGWLTTLAVITGLFWSAWLVNYLVLVRALGFLDSVLPGTSVLPRDYLLVARLSD